MPATGKEFYPNNEQGKLLFAPQPLLQLLHGICCRHLASERCCHCIRPNCADPFGRCIKDRENARKGSTFNRHLHESVILEDWQLLNILADWHIASRHTPRFCPLPVARYASHSKAASLFLEDFRRCFPYRPSTSIVPHHQGRQRRRHHRQKCQPFHRRADMMNCHGSLPD